MTFLEDCISFSQPVWNRYLHHPWIDAFFADNLTNEKFEYWLIQNLSYLGDHSAELAYSKVPPHNPWVDLQVEYKRRTSESRVELRLMDKYGKVAKTPWAARPRRAALINFWNRIAHEGNFGDICAGYYVCYTFTTTFGDRYVREKTSGLPEMQKDWVEQWVNPFSKRLKEATEIGLNEYGESATEYEKEKMKWIFMRATQLQIGTFDAAWNLSDPWPGEGKEEGVLAGMPNSEEA
jgi:thiaminase (transcriptional activator TenA)